MSKAYKNSVLLMTLVLFVSGCAYVNTSAYAKLKDKEKTVLQGSLTKNELSLANAKGLKCTGTLDLFVREPTLEVPMNCSDGRTGKVLITFNYTNRLEMALEKRKLTGVGHGILSDGTEIKVYIGKVKGTINSPKIF